MNKELKKAKEIIINEQKVSPALLQRRLMVGWAHAMNLLDDLECLGVVGPDRSPKPREILINKK